MLLAIAEADLVLRNTPDNFDIKIHPHIDHIRIMRYILIVTIIISTIKGALYDKNIVDKKDRLYRHDELV